VITITEAWLRGPVEGIAPLLQPVAHSLIQARDDVERTMPTVPPEVLWSRPHGAASAGFHLLHLAGALDRLFTYARGETLSDVQKIALKAESVDHSELTGAALVERVKTAIDNSLLQLRLTDVSSLTEERRVGRTAQPSTVIGLLFHAAEHTTRHVGQFITTIKIRESLYRFID
jgi:hypothetical protein